MANTLTLIVAINNNDGLAEIKEAFVLSIEKQIVGFQMSIFCIALLHETNAPDWLMYNGRVAEETISCTA